MVEAFPWDTAPSYLIRDSDGAYGQAFTNPLLIVYLETVDSAISKPSFSSSPCIVQPDTILRWHRDRLFRLNCRSQRCGSRDWPPIVSSEFLVGVSTLQLASGTEDQYGGPSTAIREVPD
jgi:hypothetical protein